MAVVLRALLRRHDAVAVLPRRAGASAAVAASGPQDAEPSSGRATAGRAAAGRGDRGSSSRRPSGGNYTACGNAGAGSRERGGICGSRCFQGATL